MVNPMKKVSFGSAIDQNVRRAIFSYINENTKVDEDRRVSWAGGDQIDQLISVLMDGFRIPSEISGRDASKIIYRSIIEARKNGFVTDSSVLEEANRAASEWLSREVSDYSMFCRISLSNNLLNKAYRINFDNVSMTLTATLPNYMMVPHEDILKVSNSIHPDPGVGGYLLARVQARSGYHAADLFFNAVETFISVYNLATKPWNIIGTQQRPEVSMLVGPYYLFFKNRRHFTDSGIWYNENYRKEFWKCASIRQDRFSDNMGVVRRALASLENHPLRKPILSSLLMMNDGMEAFDMSRRTLRYWTALERLFQAEDERIAYDKIIRRATYLEGPKDFSSAKLHRIVRIRNRYVHLGQTENYHHQLTQFLADFVRSHLFYILFNGDDFSNHNEVLEMTDLPSTDDALERRMRAIVRRQRMISKRRHRND